jgi:hypothetical protein
MLYPACAVMSRQKSFFDDVEREPTTLLGSISFCYIVIYIILYLPRGRFLDARDHRSLDFDIVVIN